MVIQKNKRKGYNMDEIQIKLWANLTYSLIKEKKEKEALEYLLKEYNGTTWEIAEFLGKFSKKIKKIKGE